ncbi:unnamed protein product [Ambrosiozyma monospora]|uniref:Unnamed protein product n=1 Tax=Ambrosiozyma monospora TaxID=43982 RepID=A0A9W6YSW9_AMBMO|nr:unnamed protein product [Ambrosiozyma monospora]
MSTEYTKEQEQEIQRILKIETTQYYKILNCSKDSKDTEIKKAYRKLAIKLHPDKNKHPQASDAFKKIAKAFEVLSDESKRKIYDQTGYDPDSRSAAAAASGFGGGGMNAGGFGGRGGGGHPFAAFNAGGPGGAGLFDDDLFNAFFGNGMGAGFGGGPGAFTFQFDGTGFRTTGFGPGVRFQQAQPRQRRAGGNARANGNGGRDPQEGGPLWTLFIQYLPLIILIPFVFGSLFDGFFSSDSSKNLPKFSFETSPEYSVERVTPLYGVSYYVTPDSMDRLSGDKEGSSREVQSKLKKLDQRVEIRYEEL